MDNNKTSNDPSELETDLNELIILTEEKEENNEEKKVLKTNCRSPI